MSLVHIFRWSYWFSQPQELFGKLEVIGFAIPCGFVVVALFLRLVGSIKYQQDFLLNKILYRVSNSMVFFGVTSFLWFVFRQQYIPYLSYRFWILILGGITFWWLYIIMKYSLKRVPQIRAEQLKREQKEKYFPNNYSTGR